MADYKVTYKRYSGGSWHNIYFETPVSVIAATGTRNSSSALFGDGTWKGVVLLSGDQTISGKKTFQTNLLKLYSDGQNGDMTIRLGDRDSTYGFELEYLGSGSGNNNDLILRADDQIGPSKEVFRIKQDAKLDFKTSPTINGENVATEPWVTANTRSSTWTPTWAQVTGKPSWIGSSKPSYNASEIGGLGASYRWLTDTYISQWNAKQNALGYTAENTANKRTSIRTSGANHTSYVSELGVKTYVDGQIGSVYRPAGDWNANTNLPALANNTPANSGKVYRVSTAGTRFGFTFAVGDKLAFNEDGVISKWDNVDDVVSVNGQAGTVVLTTDDIDEGSNLYVSQSEKNTWNGKQSAITGAATTITSSNLVSSRALISGSTGKVVVSEVTSTELGYLDGVTSNIQTQLNGKAASSHMHEIANVIGLQSALNGKAASSHTHSQYLTSFTESDPTVPSHVKGITSENISSWNAKQNALGFTPVPNTRKIAGLDLTTDRTRDAILGVSTNGYYRRTGTNTYDVRTVANLKTDLGLATVATSGSYADLLNKPSIPSIPSVMSASEGNLGIATTQRTINAANLKSIILNHSPAGSRPASDVSSWAKKSSLAIGDIPTGTTGSTVALGNHTHSKADVDLGNVQNYAIASKTQAEAGTSNSLYMTPLRTKELITAVMGDIESALDAILGV